MNITDLWKFKVEWEIPIERLEGLSVCGEFNRHGTCLVQGIIEKQAYEKFITSNVESSDLKIIYESNQKRTVIFAGQAEHVTSFVESGNYKICVEGISQSSKIDKEKKNRSFQNSSMNLESKKFCTTKKPGDPSKFLTYPAASELFALSANLAVFP